MEDNNPNFLLLHELKTLSQNEKQFEGFKGSTRKFTWSGDEIPHIGRYGGHRWHECFGLKSGCTRSISSQYRSLASKAR